MHQSRLLIAFFDVAPSLLHLKALVPVLFRKGLEYKRVILDKLIEVVFFPVEFFPCQGNKTLGEVYIVCILSIGLNIKTCVFPKFGSIYQMLWHSFDLWAPAFVPHKIEKGHKGLGIGIESCRRKEKIILCFRA